MGPGVHYCTQKHDMACVCDATRNPWQPPLVHPPQSPCECADSQEKEEDTEDQVHVLLGKKLQEERGRESLWVALITSMNATSFKKLLVFIKRADNDRTVAQSPQGTCIDAQPYLEEQVKAKQSHAGVERKHGSISHAYPIHSFISTFLRNYTKKISIFQRGTCPGPAQPFDSPSWRSGRGLI